jgi:hypothetical protein
MRDYYAATQLPDNARYRAAFDLCQKRLARDFALRNGDGDPEALLEKATDYIHRRILPAAERLRQNCPWHEIEPAVAATLLGPAKTQVTMAFNGDTRAALGGETVDIVRALYRMSEPANEQVRRNASRVYMTEAIEHMQHTVTGRRRHVLEMDLETFADNAPWLGRQDKKMGELFEAAVNSARDRISLANMLCNPAHIRMSEGDKTHVTGLNMVFLQAASEARQAFTPRPVPQKAPPVEQAKNSWIAPSV